MHFLFIKYGNFCIPMIYFFPVMIEEQSEEKLSEWFKQINKFV